MSLTLYIHIEVLYPNDIQLRPIVAGPRWETSHLSSLLDILLKGDLLRFFIFIANFFYMSDFMYLLRTNSFSTMFSGKMGIIIIFIQLVCFVKKMSTRSHPLN